MLSKQLIAPENQSLWTVAAFVLALVAFLMGMVSLYRTNVVLYGTQVEVMALNKKIESMRGAPQQSAAADNKAQTAAK